MAQVRNMPLTDPAILRQFYSAGPQHTAYPSKDRFVEAFGPQDHASWLQKRGIGGFSRNLALYVHIPFCNTVCPSCGRHKTVTVDPQASSRYLDYLKRELHLQCSCLDERAIVYLHWGGDTTTLLRNHGFRSATGSLDNLFEHSDKTRRSIELDPIGADEQWLLELADARVNQLCISTRECETGEDRCVDSRQIIEATESLVAAARRHGIGSIGVNMVLGVPGQTVMSFNQTLKQILALSPDRVCLQDYMRLPTGTKPQRRTTTADPLAEETRIQTFGVAVMRLAQSGYVHIGMDQFARPDDELAVAQRQGRLHRNLQGYCTHGDCDLLGVGLASMSAMGPTYSQNARLLEEYYGLIDEDVLPVIRGIELSTDDLARRTVMNALMCHFEVAFESVEIAHLLDFKRYFADELEELKAFADAGLVTIDDGWLCVTDRGRYVVWTICRVFDRYLRQGRQRASFEKVL